MFTLSVQTNRQKSMLHAGDYETFFSFMTMSTIERDPYQPV